MFKLIIILLLVTPMFAADTHKEEAKWHMSGKVMSYVNSVTAELINGGENEKEIYYISTQLNIDYFNDNFHFQATPYLYKMDTATGEKIRNTTMSKPYEKQGVFFRSLYMSYKFDDWTVGAGILPFSISVPMKFSDNSFQDGVGLNTLNDNDLTALFGIYNTENSKTIFGVGSMEELIAPVGDYISEPMIDDTLVYFIINTYTQDKWIVTNELMLSDTKYRKKDLNKVYMYGLGISWDDSSESGLSIYNVAGASILKNNSMNAKDEIFSDVFSSNPSGLDGVAFGNMLYSKYPESFALDNKTYYGGSNLLGIRYEMDMLPLETFINIEWFHTMGDWYSGNQGNMYNGKVNQMFNIRDNAYYVNFGILTTKNSLLRFTYSHLDYEEFGKVGNPASTIDADNFLGGKIIRDTYKSIHVIFTYKF